MANCPVCRSRIGDWAPSCPSCGVALEWGDEGDYYDEYEDEYYRPQRGRPRGLQAIRSTWLIIGGLIVLLFVCACAACCLGLGVTEILLSEDQSVTEAVQPAPAEPIPVPPGEGETQQDTPAPEPAAAPAPAPIGMGRSNPFPRSQAVSAPNWDFQVLEVVRGDGAWQAVQAANQFNEPPPAGMEYLLVKLRVKSTHTDSEEHLIGESDFKVTGDRLTEYSTAFAVSPDPQLDAQLFAGGETEGWAIYLIGQGESSLILFIDELLSLEGNRRRYVALDEGASISVSPELAAIQPTDLGQDRVVPAPFSQTVTAEDWEVTILEVIRGDPAWATLQNANQLNAPPAEGMEYILARVRVRYISTTDASQGMDDYSFRTTGSASVLYDHPSVVAPDPALDVDLFPGGQYEGWAVMQAAIGETGLVAVFDPLFELSGRNKRFLSLQ